MAKPPTVGIQICRSEHGCGTFSRYPLPVTRFALWAALVLASCSKTIDDGGSANVDFTNPKRVLDSVFYAARSGQSAHLASLCDPGGTANKHALRVCNEVNTSSDWPSFVEHFASGKVTSEPRITGDTAMVNFVFGQGGSESETMELVRRDGRWFLVAF